MNASDEYWKFGESERHFNNIQAGIRNRAATWLLAAFGAIAVLIKTSENTTWLVPSAVLVGLVSFLATMGLLVLWINDQLVYQRLLNAVFLIGLKREYDNKRLPPVRTMMMYSAEGKGMSCWMTLYYTIPMICFFAISISVTFLLERIGAVSAALNPTWSFWVLVALCIVQGAVTIWVQFTKSTVTPRERATLFGNEDFASMFDGTEEGLRKFGKVVKNYTPDTEGDRRKGKKETSLNT